MSFGGEISERYMRNFMRNAPAWATIVKEVERRVKSRPPTKLALLDVASGPGEPAGGLKQRFPEARVVASDVEASMIEKQKAYLRETDVESTIADANSLPFDAEEFDAVTMCFGIMYCDLEKAPKEIFRVLKPKGGVFVGTYWRKHEVTRLARDLFDEFGETALKDLMIQPEVENPNVILNSFAQAHFSEVEIKDGSYAQKCGDDFDDFFTQVSLPFKIALDKATDKSDEEKASLLARAKEAIRNSDKFKDVDDGGYSVKHNEFSMVIAIKHNSHVNVDDDDDDPDDDGVKKNQSPDDDDVVKKKPSPGDVVKKKPSPGDVVKKKPSPGDVVKKKPSPGDVVKKKPSPPGDPPPPPPPPKAPHAAAAASEPEAAV